MQFLFHKLLFSEVTTEVVLKDLYVRGEGIVSLDIIRKNGDYTTIENVIFEDGPTIIDGAFSEMHNLKTIKFSKTITKLQNYCFYRNYKLQKFIVSPENSEIWTDGSFLYQNNNKTLVGTVIRPNHLNILPTVEVLLKGSMSSVYINNEIIIPKSVVKIEQSTFPEATISSLRFQTGASIEIISQESISWCTITSFAIPPSVREIKDNAFFRCNTPNLYFEDVDKSNLTIIEKGAFKICYCKNIILPSGVTSIPNSCFSGSHLETIQISSSCTSISNTAFEGCLSLSKITVENGNKAFKDVNGSLYSIDGTQLIFAPPQLESFVVSPELESISQSLVQSLVNVDNITIMPGNMNYTSFEGCLHDFSGTILLGVCGGVRQLNISAQTTTVAAQACKGVNITSIRFLGDVCTSLGEAAFSECKNLKAFQVPKKLKSIGNECFLNSGLTSLTYEADSALDTISYRAFMHLSLKTCKLPKSLKYIGNEAFCLVSEVDEFELESGSLLQSIGYYSFQSFECAKSNKLVIPGNVTTIEQYAFHLCQLEIRFSEVSEVNALQNYVFSGCTEIRGTFVVPALVETIHTAAFYGCTNIIELIFEEGSRLNQISGSAFKNCNSLKVLSLPKNVKLFDNSAISMCFNLSEFSVDQQSESFLSNGNILYDKNMTEVVVCSPGETYAVIQANIQSIRSNAFYQCARLANVKFNTPCEIETISQNTFAECTSLTTISLPGSIKALLSGAFADCERLSMVIFDAGSDLALIGDNVFSRCRNLKSVLFSGDSLLEIGASAFEECAALKTIDIPESVAYLGKSCFKSSGVEKIVLSNIEEMGESIFQNCSSLESLTLRNITSVSSYAFDRCTKLSRIELSSNLQILAESAFSGASIINLSIPFYVTKIDLKCFANCNELKIVNISSHSLREIGNNCFAGCNNIKQVIYCGTNPITSRCGLPQTAIAYVSSSYNASSFCGLALRKWLTDDCIIVYPTEVFTTPAGEPLIGFHIISPVIAPIEDMAMAD